jgi:four helix bundle protein
MATIRRIEEIQAWQKARELVRETYKTCAEGPLARDFGLRDQIRRAAVSSMSNIAEGFARKTDKEFAHFLDIARGSAIEAQSLLYVALDVQYINRGEFARLSRLADETASLIGGLTSYLRAGKRRSEPADRTLDRQGGVLDSAARTADRGSGV